MTLFRNNKIFVESGILSEVNNTKENTQSRYNYNCPCHFYGPRGYEAMTETASLKLQPSVNKNVVKQTEAGLPFVAATSVSKSHNILLNYQQVLASLKRRQPVVGQGGDNCLDTISEYPIQEGIAKGSNFIKEPQVCCLYKDEERFKTVLKKLYEDFTSLSLEYESNMKTFLKGGDKLYLKKELIRMDNTLRHKQEEIVVLIGLYRELIKTKERLRRVEDAAVKGKQGMKLGTSPSTNLRLKFLLHQVKKFQDQLDKLKR